MTAYIIGSMIALGMALAIDITDESDSGLKWYHIVGCTLLGWIFVGMVIIFVVNRIVEGDE